MSAAVKLGSKLPGETEINGVDAIAPDLVDDPAAIRLGIVYFDVQTVLEDTDTGDHVPTIRIRRFEPISRVEDAPPSLKKLVGDAFQARTGRKPIPFEIATAEQIERPADPYGDELPEGDA